MLLVMLNFPYTYKEDGMQRKSRPQIDTIIVIKAVIRILVAKVLFVFRTTPLGVMFIAGIMFYKAEVMPTHLSSALPMISYLILAFGMLITSCFNRSRFFFILLVLFLSQLSLISFTSEYMDKGFSFQGIYAVISLLVPLNILFFSSLSEGKILSAWGQKNFIIILLQIISILALLLSGRIEGFLGMNGGFSYFSFIPETPIPTLSVFAYSMAGLVLLIKRRRTTLYFKRTLFGALVAVFFAQHFYIYPIGIPLFYSTAGVIIILSIIQDYYFKAYLDELTNLPSRRSLNEEMMNLNNIYTIAMVDVDFFKKFNDKYGHDAGDDVLRLIARVMKEHNKGKAFRYGGEEFTIVFPGKKMEDAVPCLEELREKISKCRFLLRGEREKGIDRRLNVTVSIGVAESTTKSIGPEEVIKAADAALYQAKEQGRNCVCKA